MDGKKADRRFSIQFSRMNPEHIQVAEILNRHKRYDKAQYIVNAVLHYENCDKVPEVQRPARFDEKIIEAVVNRILHDRGGVVAALTDSVSVKQTAELPLPAEEISFDDAMEALGEDGFNVIADALNMFRRK